LGAFILACGLELQRLALAGANDGEGGFDLGQNGADFAELFAVTVLHHLNVNQLLGGGKFLV